MMGRFHADLKHAWRSACAHPATASAVALVVSLGIGLGSAIFALADPFLLRPLPYASPDELVVVELKAERGSFDQVPPTLRDWRQRQDLFRDAAAYRSVALARLRSSSGALVVQTIEATPNLFAVLGVAVPGLDVSEAERQVHVRQLVLLREAAQRLFHGGRDLPGGTLVDQDGRRVRVAATLPGAFLFPRAQVRPRLDAVALVEAAPLIEVTRDDEGQPLSSTAFSVVARLRAGVTPRAVQAALDVSLARCGVSATVDPVSSLMTRRVKPLALGALSAGLLILGIASANLANLLLARSAFRAREFATRLAVGASRLDLLRLMLAEVGLVVALSTGLGLACAHGVLRVAAAVIPAEYAALGAPAVTLRVVACAVVSAAFLMLAGLAPSWYVWRRMSAAAATFRVLPSETRLASCVRFAMVGGQCAIAMVLLVGAAMLVRSQVNLETQDTGFAPHALSVAVSYPPERSAQQLQGDVDESLARLRRLAGVKAAGAATGTVVDDMRAATIVRVGRRPELVERKAVTAGFLDAVGARLRDGRLLRDTDRGAVLVNESFARRHWPGQRAVGRQIVVGETPSEIVGVVGDTFDVALDRPPDPTVFTPMRTPFAYRVTYALGLAGPSRPSDLALQRVFAFVNQDAVVVEARLLRDRLASTVDDRSFATLVLTVFAVAGVGVCAAGIAGVVAFVVSRRTREIAIRVAVGAEPSRIRRMVMAEAAAAATVGSLAGLIAGAMLARAGSSLLYGVAPGDWPTTLAAAVLMLAIVGVAAAIPASRAVHLAPTDALRVE
jgi:putative ABC transport system permease protein